MDSSARITFVGDIMCEKPLQQAFDSALSDSLCMQGDIYQKMASKGWYPTQQADQQQISQVKQKYAGK